VPVSSDSTPAAAAALELELRRLVSVLREAWGVTLDDAAIGDAIRLYNRQRRMLEDVAAARRAERSPLTGADVFALQQVLSAIPVDEGNALLERLLAELPDMPAADAAGARLFLVSSHFEDLNRMAVIERFGGPVVGDLMCTGTGYFHGQVDESEPPLAALAGRALRRLSCAHAADEIDRRLRFIADGVREGRCDAVILDRLSFCAIAAAEYFVLARRLKTLHIPTLELEGELHGGGEGQLRTRLEAFREQLANRGAAR
jgi:benzoyl-CoA reductase/2-hydroxyglutaryl-CoA dehydratase subunit BcrC/BadD/HgdB